MILTSKQTVTKERSNQNSNENMTDFLKSALNWFKGASKDEIDLIEWKAKYFQLGWFDRYSLVSEESSKCTSLHQKLLNHEKCKYVLDHYNQSRQTLILIGLFVLLIASVLVAVVAKSRIGKLLVKYMGQSNLYAQRLTLIAFSKFNRRTSTTI